MEQFDEKKLKLFIEEKFKVSSHRTPFYVYWIKMFKNYTKKLDSTDNIQDKFINSLNNKYPEWQVKQADKAVTIYHSFVRNSNTCSTNNRTKDNSIWKNTIFNMNEDKVNGFSLGYFEKLGYSNNNIMNILAFISALLIVKDWFFPHEKPENCGGRK